MHQGKIYREISKRYLYHKAASRQSLQRNQQTVLISQSCIKANYTEKSANGTYITKLHQGKLHREISKKYSHCCIKINSTEKKKFKKNYEIVLTPLHQDKLYIENDQWVLKLLYQDKLYREMTKQYSHCWTKVKSTDNWTISIHSAASRQSLERIRWTVLTLLHQTQHQHQYCKTIRSHLGHGTQTFLPRESCRWFEKAQSK